MSVMPLPENFSLSMVPLWAGAMFFLLLAVRSVLQNRSSRKGRDVETIEWGPPRPSLTQRWRIKMGRMRIRLPRVSQRQMPEIAQKPAPPVPADAPVDPLKKPAPPMLGLFCSTIGAPETKSKEAFAWKKTKGIE